MEPQKGSKNSILKQWNVNFPLISKDFHFTIVSETSPSYTPETNKNHIAFWKGILQSVSRALINVPSLGLVIQLTGICARDII